MSQKHLHLLKTLLNIFSLLDFSSVLYYQHQTKYMKLHLFHLVCFFVFFKIVSKMQML